MNKKKNPIAVFFSWLAYKEKTDRKFVIPEAEEIQENQKSRKSQEAGSDRDKTGGRKSRDVSGSQSPSKKEYRLKSNQKELSSGLQPARHAKKLFTQDQEAPGSVKKSKRTGNEKKGDRARSGNGKTPSSNIDENLDILKKEFNSEENKDVIYRKFCIADGTEAFAFFVDGMIDKTVINLSILQPMLNKAMYKDLDGKNLFDFTYDSVIETHQMKKVNTTEEAISEVLTGNAGIFIDGFPSYILCETKGYEKRNVDKPQVEGVVKGAQEAFNENLRTNITLIRRILKNRQLTTNFIDVGKRNNAKCAVLYLKNLANPALVKETIRRLKSIDSDFIMGDGMLEQFIEDNPFSIIPTTISTERPDRATAHLVEGKVVVLSEGTPFALIIPVTIADFLHSPEDTTLRWQYGTFLRLIRYFALFVATLLPGMYVALTTFHSEMIPTDLLIAIAKARENVPFPTIVEVLLMEISFELIREAGIRIPGIIGNTIGIIGALILGQAAVQANLVSPVLIIIVAFTGLGNFAIPDFSLAFGARIMRLFYIALGSFLGFYGISLGILISLALTVSLNSFGVPLFGIIAPKTAQSFDFLLRWPVWKQEMRPDYLNPLDITRQPPISRKWVKESPERNGPGGKDGSNE